MKEQRSLAAIRAVLALCSLTIIPQGVLGQSAQGVVINIDQAMLEKGLVIIQVGGDKPVKAEKGVVLVLGKDALAAGATINIGTPTESTIPPVNSPTTVGTSLGTAVLAPVPPPLRPGASLGTGTGISGTHKEQEHRDMLKAFNEKAPDTTYSHFQTLDKEHLLAPDTGSAMDHLNRWEGAVLTARSYNRLAHYVPDAAGKTYSPAATDATQALLQEFLPEAEDLGYGSTAEAKATVPVEPGAWDWQIHGEARYSVAHNTGDPRYTWRDNRWRLRLYGEKKISDNWSLVGMVESDKSHISHAADEALGHDNNDGDVTLSRLYAVGKYNWHQIPVTLEIGKTYAFLGDGNVLDSDFHGVKAESDVTPEVTATAGVGKVNDTESMQFLEAWRRHRQYDYMVGYYHWDNYGQPTGIYAAGLNYYIGNYTLGGMYLAANQADGSGAKDGYVLSARYGKNMSWIPHTYEFDLKYYNQAGRTYINHTMNGLGSYMDGFSGWGAMFYYTLRENLLFSLQYFDLTNKTTDEDGRTLWTELTWGF